jgi:hypothetical protein
MKARSPAKPEQSRHQDSRDRGGQGQQAMAVLDSRPEMAQQQSLLSLMAGSPRLQRKCACGAPSAAGGSCAACEGKQNSAKPVVLQKQLAIGAADDPLEREADRVADQVMAAPSHSAVSGAPLRIQRFQNQGGGQMDKAPASVERVLASSGRPLDPALQQDMEQRFGHDFSRVRLHTDAEAERSARDVNAHAYTVGSNIVFGADQFSPATRSGRQLIAHELAHVVQQSYMGQPRLNRFESRLHQSVERVGLTHGSAMTNEEASAVYFGNWMRDMNQVFVPLLTDLMPPDVLFSLIAYMAANTFGRELTPEQFGYYIPAEHLDNPGGLVAADDLLPSQPAVSPAARPPIPTRLGGTRPAHLDTPQEPVDPATGSVHGVNILNVDQTGVMVFIRRTNLHIERRLQLAANAGRNPDGMHHFGAALHAVEDLFAHSNFVEIAVDRLLRTDATFLDQPIGTDRQVFTYTPRVRSGGEERPLLTTGTFTGPDTQVSIGSEITGLLSRPLPAPATREEQRAQDQFMVAILRHFEAHLRANPNLRRLIRTTLIQNEIPEFLANRADQVPVADIYQFQTLFGFPIPDAVRIPIKQLIRDAVSTNILRPIAGQIQAAGLEARVADTNLIQVLRASRLQEQGQFTRAERETMRQRESLTGQSVAQQMAATRAAGQRRTHAIRGTPIHVVAGPSHSQITKDHPNSPFFGLAFRLASLAVERLRDRMLAVWNEPHGTTTPFNFGWRNYPHSAPPGSSPADSEIYEAGRRLYHAGRPQRSVRERESLQTGSAILLQGGQPGQPFDLAGMRHQSAERIRAVANALRAITGTPNASATAIVQIRSLAGQLIPAVEQRLRQQLIQAQVAATAAGASQAVADINTVAGVLETVAAQVETARRHSQRELTNAALAQQRQQMLIALARQPGLNAELGAILLYILNEEIQATAVTYSSEQRAVLEGRQTVQEIGPTPRGITVSTLTLPPVTGSAAMQALLNEARLLIAHPYDNNWWEPSVRQYAASFPARLINDIEARNEGVPSYRSAGGAGSHGHSGGP